MSVCVCTCTWCVNMCECVYFQLNSVCVCVHVCKCVCISNFLFSQMKPYVDSEYAKHNKTPVLLFEMFMVKGKLQPGPLTTMLPFCLLEWLSRTFHGIRGFAETLFENHQYSLTSNRSYSFCYMKPMLMW